MRSPVYLPRNPKVSKHLWSCYPDSNWSPRPAEQVRGSPERSRSECAFAGMRSPVLPIVKKPSKPEGFEGFWSCYPDSNWSPRPAEQARGSPERPRIRMRFAQGMSLQFAYGKENLQNPKALKVSGAAIQIRTGVHVLRSRPASPSDLDQNALRAGDEVSSLSCNNKEMLRNPKVSKHLWSCYPDSNWSPCPAEQARGSPERPRLECASRKGDEVSSFAL